MAPPLNRTNQALAIPEDIQYELMADIYGNSAVLQLADVDRMTGATQTVVTGDAFTWPSGMENVAEGAAKPVAEGTLTSYEIVAKKMAVFVVVTDELLADSPVDIVGYYREAIAQKFQHLIDYHAIRGGGPFDTDGLEDVAATSIAIGDNQVGGADDVSADLAAVFAAVEDADYTITGTLAARRLKSQLRGLRDGNGRPLYIDSLTADTPDQIYGEPLLYVGKGQFGTGASATQAITGDFSKFHVRIREDLTFSLHNEGTIGSLNLLEKNLTALRAEMRLGGVISDGDAFALLTNAAA